MICVTVRFSQLATDLNSSQADSDFILLPEPQQHRLTSAFL